MSRPDRFEDQLAALAAKVASASSPADVVELSEELLLQYYAGMLSKEESARVGRLAALSPRASAYLAQLELDAREAAASTDRRTAWTRALSAIRGFSVSLGRARTLSLATGALAAVLALVIVVPPLLQGPPDFGVSPYVVSPGQGKSIEVLPGGDRVGDVAADWSLHVPSGRVTELSWFVWQSVEGAERYGLQLIGPTGRVIFASSTSDPHVKIAKSARSEVPKGQECAWVVEALDAQGELLARGVGRFTLD